MAERFASVDDYIGSFPDDVQSILSEIRRRILVAVPAADQRISYGIAAFTLDGKDLVYLAGWKRHISVYPVPAGDDAFERELDPYRAGKGTLKFPRSQPIPFDLIERVVARLAQGRVSSARLDPPKGVDARPGHRL